MRSKKILNYLKFFLFCISICAFAQEATPHLDTQSLETQELITIEESTIVQHVLEHIFLELAEKNEEPSDRLVNIYAAVIEKKDIGVEDLNFILPQMIECMKQIQLRATRPDAPGIGNGAISGCCGCCDISRVLAILAAIQARLVIINNLIIECCDEIQFDFQATWSILANLNVTATVDLSPVFSVITNCCNGTFSAIANLTLTATTDLSGVFSALNACCNSTFSMLNRIDREVVDTFSVLNTIIINEQGTFTAIAACCNATFSAIANLTLTATADLSGLFTSINACCNGTFSMLDRIDREVVGTFSLLNRIIIDDQGTFSAIAACCNGTFSALANLTLTATADLSGIFSALAACCNGTFSVLANLSATATADLSPVFSVLAAGFNGTFSSLFDIKNTLTACGAIPIYTATVITVSGNYCLANDIVGSITITANEVNLDLNNFSIIASTTGTLAELLAGGPFFTLVVQNATDVIVRNGSIIFKGANITNCSNILLDSITSYTNSFIGDFFISSCLGVTVKNCSVYTHSVNDFGFGGALSVNDSQNIMVENFSVNNSLVAGPCFNLIRVNNFVGNGLTANGLVLQGGGIRITSCNNLSFKNISNCNCIYQASVDAVSVTRNTDAGGLPMTNIIIEDSLFNSNLFLAGGNIINLSGTIDGALRLPIVSIKIDNVISSSNFFSSNNKIINATAVDNLTLSNCLLVSNSFVGGGNIIALSNVTDFVIRENEIRNNNITGPGSVELLTMDGFCRNGELNNNNLIGNICSTQGSSSLILINPVILVDTNFILSNTYNADTGNTVLAFSADSIIKNNTILGNYLGGVGNKILMQAAGSTLLENNDILFNQSLATSFTVITAQQLRNVVLNNNINANETTNASGVITGIAQITSTSLSSIKKNIVNANIGSQSFGIVDTGGATYQTMIVENEAQGHTTDYFTSSGTIPIATLSYSTGTVTPLPAPLSSYHNLSMVA